MTYFETKAKNQLLVLESIRSNSRSVVGVPLPLIESIIDYLLSKKILVESSKNAIKGVCEDGITIRFSTEITNGKEVELDKIISEFKENKKNQP